MIYYIGTNSLLCKGLLAHYMACLFLPLFLGTRVSPPRHTCIQTCIHTSIRMYIHAYTHTHIHTHTHTHTYIHTCIHTFTHTHTHTHTHTLTRPHIGAVASRLSALPSASLPVPWVAASAAEEDREIARAVSVEVR
jgi:hypothetical protein